MSMSLIFSLGTVTTKVSALKSLKEKKDFDMLDDWFEQVEQKRKNVGKSTCIFVQKPHLNK